MGAVAVAASRALYFDPHGHGLALRRDDRRIRTTVRGPRRRDDPRSRFGCIRGSLRRVGRTARPKLDMLELYHNDMSVCAAKVRLTLAEKGVPYTGHHLNLRAGDQREPGYLALNPKGVVPTL